MIIDIASLVDKRLKVKETEQVKKDFGRVKKVKVIPVVVGVLGSKSKKIKSGLGKWVDIRIGLLQKTVFLGTVRILRKMLKVDNEKDNKGPEAIRYGLFLCLDLVLCHIQTSLYRLNSIDA